MRYLMLPQRICTYRLLDLSQTLLQAVHITLHMFLFNSGCKYLSMYNIYKSMAFIVPFPFYYIYQFIHLYITLSTFFLPSFLNHSVYIRLSTCLPMSLCPHLSVCLLAYLYHSIYLPISFCLHVRIYHFDYICLRMVISLTIGPYLWSYFWINLSRILRR